MKCIYINLDSQLERRHALEQSFSNAGAANHTLHRFSAIAGDNVDPTRFTAPLFQNVAASYISHLEAPKSQLSSNDHIFILKNNVFTIQ